MEFSPAFRFLAPVAIALACCLGVTGTAAAQSDDPGVSYVSALNGSVSIQRGDSGAEEGAAVNAPLMAGDYLMTGSDGRAEVQFDYGHVVRVGPDAQVRVGELDSTADTLQLAAGSIGVGVLHGTADYVQIETPSVTIRPRAGGYYRVAVEPDGTTEITVRSGNAAILLPQGTRTLRAGSTMYVSGPADDPSFRYVHPLGYDSFDRWNNDRDAAFARSHAYNYAPDFIPGAYTLDNYGQWVNTPDYGYEWIPNDVASDWTPYSSGQWTDEPYYGWTWVDTNPWGYAPFHYGRWYRDSRRNRWAWTPGRRNAPRQQWSPALVAFIGFGNVGISISLNNDIGWVPLAPSEQPHPWWGAGARNYSAAAVPNFRTAYANARWSNAVRAVPRAQFATGGYQRPAPVAPAYFSHAVVLRAAVNVVPQPQALRYAQHAAPVVRRAAPPAQAFHAFRTAPQPPQTFTQQRAQAAAVVQHAPPPVPERRAPQAARPPAGARPPAPAGAPHAPPGAMTHPQAATPPHAAPAQPHAPGAPAAPQEHRAPEGTAPNRAPVRPVTPVHPEAAPPAVPHAAGPAPVVHQQPAAPPVFHPQAAAPPVVHHEAVPAPAVHQQPATPPVVRQQPAAPPVFHPQAAPPVVRQQAAPPVVRQQAAPPVERQQQPAPAVQRVQQAPPPQRAMPVPPQGRAPAAAPVKPAPPAKPAPDDKQKPPGDQTPH